MSSTVAVTPTQTALQIVRHMESYSRVISKEREQTSVARFDRDEIVLGELLGTGGFNNVYALHAIEIDQFLPQEDSDDDLVEEDVQGELRLRLAHSVRQGDKYAVKFLKKETMDSPLRFCNGAADLMVEAKLLGSIRHPNIVSLYGIAAAGALGFRQDLEGGFFLIVDALSMTLSGKITAWRDEQRSEEIRMMTSEFLNRGRKLQKKEQQFFLERFQIAMDLSSALTYLHKKSIIFRDLKPDNIGFTAEGQLKLFDFGLAKELDPRERTSNVEYKMSGQTGSRRYMAPEVVLSQPYSLAADIYSFIIVVYEIFSLQPAFKGMNLDDHLELVVIGKGRPDLDPLWPSVLSTLLKCGWSSNPSNRPTMEQINRSLEKTIHSMKANIALEEAEEVGRAPLEKQGAGGEQRPGRRLSRRHHHRMSLNHSPPPPPAASGTWAQNGRYTPNRVSSARRPSLNNRSPTSRATNPVVRKPGTENDPDGAPIPTQPGRRKASRRSSM